MAHICTHHFQNDGVQDEKSLSCFQVVSSHWALEYAEAMGKPCRFLNMAPEQIARRKETRRKQKCRAVKKKEKKRRGVKHSKKSDCSKENKASVSEHSIEQRKLRPCCGRRHDKCTCEPLPRNAHRVFIHVGETIRMHAFEYGERHNRRQCIPRGLGRSLQEITHCSGSDDCYDTRSVQPAAPSRSNG